MIVLLAMIVTIGGIVADERGARTLPTLLRDERLRIKERVVAYCKALPFCAVLRILVVVG